MRSFFLLLIVLSILSFFGLLLFFKETYLYEASIHLGIFSLAMYLIWKKDLHTTLRSIGIPGDIKSHILYTFLGLVLVFALLMALGLASYALGFNDNAKVAQKIGTLPSYIILLAIFGAPIAEELLFRAYLVPRTGIILSSIIFGAVHLAYGSVVEVVGVALVGMILAWIFRRSKSVAPCIAIHITYNLISISVMRLIS